MYQSPHQFEPLLLNERQLESVASLSEGIVMRSVKLTSAAHATTRVALRELVRKMNSFYSNRIEGQNTHPRNIERALENDFSQKPGEARLQRIALAHIGAEKEMEALGGGGSALRSTFLIDAHRALYERLEPGDRLVLSQSSVDVFSDHWTTSRPIRRRMASTGHARRPLMRTGRIS
jgi:hypothetical protein